MYCTKVALVGCGGTDHQTVEIFRVDRQTSQDGAKVVLPTDKAAQAQNQKMGRKANGNEIDPCRSRNDIGFAEGHKHLHDDHHIKLLRY